MTHLRGRLSSGWRASLLARDGSLLAAIPQQLREAPSDTTHLIISAGGNDALGYSFVLTAPSRSIADSLTKLADIQQQFRKGYGRMLDAVLERGLPTALCTIYDPRYADRLQRRVSVDPQ